MSDFLNNFSGDKYDNMQKKKPGNNDNNPVQKEAPKQAPKDAGPVESKNTGVPENARDELFERDPNSLQRKRKRRFLMIFGLLVVFSLIVTLFYLSRVVKLPNFVGDYADKTEVWAMQNNIFVETEEEFNLDYSRGTVISQTPGPAERLFKGGSIKILVSRGTDPKEHIPLPDFTVMSAAEVEEWIDENKAENAVIARAYDDTVPANQVIKSEFRDSSVTADTYKREDRMTITVSRGPEVFEEDIEVPNFREEMEQEAVQWANSEDVKLIVEEDYSDTVSVGFIIRQSIPPETMIAKNEELTITVSKGRAIYVPSFSGLSKNEALVEAAMAGISLTTIDQYHSTVEAGQMITQSQPAGSLLKDGRNSVIAYYSSGLPYVPDLSGRQESDVVQVFTALNEKDAELKYELEYVYDATATKGTVVHNSHANESVAIGSTVTVTISKGGKVIIGSYVNKNYQSYDIASELEELRKKGLKINYQYVDYSEEDEDDPNVMPPGLRESGTIVKQSIEPGTQVSAAEHVLVLTISH